MPAFLFSLGVLLSRAFAPVNFFPAVLIVIPLMIALIDRARSGREAFRTGWWTGFGLFAVGLAWIGESFRAQSNAGVTGRAFAGGYLGALCGAYLLGGFQTVDAFPVAYIVVRLSLDNL